MELPDKDAFGLFDSLEVDPQPMDYDNSVRLNI